MKAFRLVFQLQAVKTRPKLKPLVLRNDAIDFQMRPREHQILKWLLENLGNTDIWLEDERQYTLSCLLICPNYLPVLSMNIFFVLS